MKKKTDMNFARWSFKQLKAEAKRLDVPMWHKCSKQELIEILTEAHS
jgi:hypothetical protein